MSKRRIFVTGLGGHLGTSVALALEAGSDDAVMGADIDPPRRHLRRTEFERVPPEDSERLTSLIREFDPTHVVHLGIYEPHARSSPGDAHARSLSATEAVFRAVSECESVERIVVRSGIEIYGRRRQSPLGPDEDSAVDPTTAFGRTLRDVEEMARAFARDSGVPVAPLRYAPIVGPHIPSPIGRYLRLPVVPVAAVPDLPFSLLHIDDMTSATIAALAADWSGPLNVVGEGAVSGSQAVRLGGRIPVPVMGPVWTLARSITGLLGSPLPQHGVEMLTRGRTADGARAHQVLDWQPRFTTVEVVKDLYQWASVVYLDTREAA
ncbi:MAG: NAD-dependent epimerase/dehydratase family protein [Acidimicrobiales bacterium]